MAENLRVGIDGTEAVAGSKRVVRSFKDIIKGATGLGRATDKTTQSIDSTAKSFTVLGRAAKGAIAFLGVRQLIDYADAWTQVGNRLALVTDTAEETFAVQEDLFFQAQENRVAFESTAELYQRLARAGESLNRTTEETIQSTDLISKAITISGVSAEAANAAVIQLGQGLAAGALRGDELRSVLEQTPRLAQAIAEGLGRSVGELRDLGAQGALTAEAVLGAIEASGADLEEEFARLAPTIGQSFTNLRSSFVRFTGTLADDTGAVTEFAGAIQGLADFIAGPATDATINLSVGFGALTDTFALVADGLGDFVSQALDDFGLLEEGTTDVSGLLAFTFTNLPLIARKGFLSLGNEINSFIDTAETQFELFKNTVVGTLATIFGDEAVVEEALAARQDFNNDLIAIEEERAATQLQIDKDLDDSLLEIETRRAERQRRLAEGRAQFGDRGAGGAGAAEAELSKQAQKAKESLDELRASTELFQAQLQGLEEGGEEGLAFVNDLETAADLFAELNGEVAITEDEVLLLVQAEREAEAALAAANDQLERQANAATALGDLRQEAQNLAEQLAAIEGGGLEQLQQVEALQQARDLMAEFGTEAGITEEELTALVLEIERTGEAVQKAKEDAEGAAGGFEIFSEAGKQAARNVQDSLADFLFDPFQDGLDGMLSGFVDTLRRMAAEALAAQILQSIGGGLAGAGAGAGGGFGAFLTGAASIFAGRQDGGPVAANQPVVVGEKEPEVFVPDRPGTVLNQKQLAAVGGGTPNVDVNNNITNVVDPGAMLAVMESGAGSRAILNVIDANPDAIKRRLA